MSVEGTTAAAVDKKVRDADWHFMWLTAAHFLPGGRTTESACNKALAQDLNKVLQRFNAAELSLIKIRKSPRLYVTQVMLQIRQIQQHASLGLVDKRTLRENTAF
jgi:hypothetical protein